MLVSAGRRAQCFAGAVVCRGVGGVSSVLLGDGDGGAGRGGREAAGARRALQSPQPGRGRRSCFRGQLRGSRGVALPGQAKPGAAPHMKKTCRVWQDWVRNPFLDALQAGQLLTLKNHSWSVLVTADAVEAMLRDKTMISDSAAMMVVLRPPQACTRAGAEASPKCIWSNSLPRLMGKTGWAGSAESSTDVNRALPVGCPVQQWLLG